MKKKKDGRANNGAEPRGLGGEPRGYCLRVRISETELDCLTAAAERSGEATVSNYVRDVVFARIEADHPGMIARMTLGS